MPRPPWRARPVEALVAQLEQQVGRTSISTLQVRLRYAAWRRDAVEMRRLHALMPKSQPSPPFMHFYASAILGDITGDEIDQAAQPMLDASKSVRFVTLACQLLTEAHAASGRSSAGAPLPGPGGQRVPHRFDWLDRCPLLEALRGHEQYPEIRAKVAQRAQAIWSHSPEG